MSHATDAVRLRPAEMRNSIPGAGGERFHIGLLRGELQVELYVPQNEDLQQPHSRDECYVVIRGSGRFQMGEDTVPFEAGDFLFVPAGMEHRFLDFGSSLETWVIFYGPEGGEQLG
ncbi:cupin domain-containing protein [Leisingera sp. JC1]|uniref:cupin domain-containing protein n=1 Tax=Leisingera sp. JC1 TaxID=1855282 RepID=UPI000AE87960|nr:cupin domain-containing protein [Leisingera sp. JC1]